MFGLFRKKLTSNQAINKMSGGTEVVQNQMAQLQELQRIAQKQASAVKGTPNVQDYSSRMLQQNQDLLNRK